MVAKQMVTNLHKAMDALRKMASTHVKATGVRQKKTKIPVKVMDAMQKAH